MEVCRGYRSALCKKNIHKVVALDIRSRRKKVAIAHGVDLIIAREARTHFRPIKDLVADIGLKSDLY